MVGNNLRLLGIVADATQGSLGMLARFCDGKAHPIVGHLVLLTPPLSRFTGSGRQRSIGLRAAAVSSSRRRGVSIGAARKLDASPDRAAGSQRLDGRDELVERGLAFGLGRLDQHRPMDDQRKVHRHRMIAFVDQRLGEVERGDPGILQKTVVEQHLMHAQARKGKAELAFEAGTRR